MSQNNVKLLKHEMNNELQTLFHRISHLLEQEPHIEKNKELHLLLQTSRKLKALVQTIDEPDQFFQLQIKHINLHKLFIDTVEEMKTLTQSKNIRIHFEKKVDGEHIFAWCDAQKIREILVNLIKNATEALVENGEIIIELKESFSEWILLCKDSGPGIPFDLKEKIFLSNFSTKKNSVERGFGLSICKKIAELHGGELENLETDKGACFSLIIPKPDLQTSKQQLGKENILLIDDDLRLLHGLEKILEQNYHTISYANAQTALSFLVTNSFSGFLIVDIGSIGKTLDEIEHFSSQLPAQLYKRLILTTGDSPHSDLVHSLLKKNIPIVFKPYDVKKLFQIIRTIADHKE